MIDRETWGEIDLYFLKTEPEEKTLGTFLKRLRYTYAVPQNEFAKFLDVPLNSYAAYENDKVNPTFSVMTKIADKLQISLDYFAGNLGYGYYKTYAQGLFAENPKIEMRFEEQMERRIDRMEKERQDKYIAFLEGR